MSQISLVFIAKSLRTERWPVLDLPESRHQFVVPPMVGSQISPALTGPGGWLTNSQKSKSRNADNKTNVRARVEPDARETTD
jgi:hypothetical protein